jgi:hypothetical protein
MKLPFTISLSNCEENDGIKGGLEDYFACGYRHVTSFALSDRKLATIKAKPAEIFIGATTFSAS